MRWRGRRDVAVEKDKEVEADAEVEREKEVEADAEVEES